MINKVIFAVLVLGVLFCTIGGAFAAETWDPVFPKNDKVAVEKVFYNNRYGISIAADMYYAKDMDKSKKHPAIIVGTPYGGVKEQSAGLYAQEMAARGFVAIAFDESFNGESDGRPRHISSPEIFTEDFSAGVDFIGTRPFVDRNRIGAIGICGSGGFALSAAQVDRRIKAVATVSMYDMTRVMHFGWKDSMTDEQRNSFLDGLAEQRWQDFESGSQKMDPSFPAEYPTEADPITKEFYDYYGMPRGKHPNSIGAFTVTSKMSFMNFPLLTYIKTISPRPILFIIGETAHSRYFSEDAYKMANEPKELFIVPGAGHVDLYDKVELIPFNKLAAFFGEQL